MSVHTSLLSVIHIRDADVPFVSSAKILCVTLDSNLSVNNACKTLYIQIKLISSMRFLLITQATQTLVCRLVLSQIIVALYSQVLLSICQTNFKKVQNTGRLVCTAKNSGYIQSTL